MTVSQRPGYVPSWYSWWPGEDPKAAAEYTIREASQHDVDGVLALIRATSPGTRVSRKRFSRWLTQNTYSLRLVCRNYRHPIAACLSRTGSSGTRVELLCVAPQYAGKGLDERLLGLACAELPEQPTTILLASDDMAAAARLRDLGWKFTRNDRENSEFEFSRRLVTFGPANPGPPGDLEAAAAAGDE